MFYTLLEAMVRTQSQLKLKGVALFFFFFHCFGSLSALSLVTFAVAALRTFTFNVLSCLYFAVT